MKRTRILAITWIYALILLSILLLSVSVLTLALRRSRSAEERVESTYVYVKQEDDQTEVPITETEPPLEEGGWIMQTYSNRIGIFKQDGTLLHVLDIYVKTLPEADRRLLGEGIPVQTRAELYALIEDYTG